MIVKCCVLGNPVLNDLGNSHFGDKVYCQSWWIEKALRLYTTPMSDPAFQHMSVAEYLRSEPESPVKREYVDGSVYSLDDIYIGVLS